MADDIVSRLVLRTSEFNGALQQSEQRVRQFSSNSGRAVQTFGDKIRNVGTLANSLAGLAIFGTITKGLKDSAQAAITFESAFAGVRKTVDETEAGFQALIKRFTELSTATPVSREELSRIGELAGQLGVSGVENLSKFVETIARISVSTNLTAEQAATNFAQFANVIQLPLDQVDRLGAAIVGLGNNFATTESDISNMSQRLAGAGKTVGLSASEILGFSAALSSVGIEAESGGTAFSKVFILMAEAASQGNAALAEFTGNSVEAFQGLVRNNPAEAVLQFVEALGRVKAEGGDLFAVLDEFGIKEIRLRNALLSTANAGDLVRKALALSGKAFEENTALVEESEKRFQTTESQLGKISNSFSNLSAEIGAALLPALKDLAETIVPVIRSVVEWAKENPNLVKSLVAMAGVVAVGGALVAGIGALAFAVTALGAVGGPVLAAVAGVAALVGAFVGLKDKVPAAIEAMGVSVMSGLDAFAKGMANAATVGVEAFATMLESINNFLSEFPSRAFRSGVALVDEFAKGLASRTQAAVDAVGEMVGKVRDYLPFSPAKEGPLSDLDKSGEAFGEVLAEGIVRGSDQPVDAVEAMAERLHSELNIRGSIPTRKAGVNTRGSGGQFTGQVQRSGTGFLDGANESLKSFVSRTQDSFAQGVAIADAGINAMNQAVDKFSVDLVSGEIQSLGDVFKGLRDVAVESLKEIAQELIKLAIIKTIAAGFSAGFSGGLGGGAGAGPFAGLAGQPGFAFASGGSFMVGGPSGTDRTPVSFMASRGEKVTVETPDQQRRGGLTINFYDQAGVNVQQQERQTASGSALDVFITRRVRQINRNDFGLPPKPGRVG